MSVDPSMGVSAAATAAQNQAVQSTLTAGGTDAQSIKINNMEELKAEAPAVYDAVMKSMAWSICSKADDFNKKMIEFAKQAEQASRSR